MKLTIPNWFARPKQDKPASSADVAIKLKAAEEAYAAAQLRVDTARATLAAVRDEPALKGLRVAKDESDEAAEMLAILRDEHQAALERERQEHLAQVRVRRDAARTTRAEHVAREASITARAAALLVEGWVTLHVERAAELAEAAALDREIRSMATELGEQEPAFTLATQPSMFALSEAVAALASEVPPQAFRLLQELAHAIEPAASRIQGMQQSAATAARLAEERRLKSLARPAPPPPDVVRLDQVDEPGPPAQERPMVRQLTALLGGNSGDAA